MLCKMLGTWFSSEQAFHKFTLRGKKKSLISEGGFTKTQQLSSSPIASIYSHSHQISGYNGDSMSPSFFPEKLLAGYLEKLVCNRVLNH